MKPIVSPLKHASDRVPDASSTGAPRRWIFSFRFFRQIELFGLSDSDPNWFVSLLNRLADLSAYEVDKFRADRMLKRHWRYHEIDLSKKKVPIKRCDLKWIDQDYLDNEEEYPLVQVMVSKALGRIVGFWDERSVFNIVLLDPLHNIQPTKSFEYRVDSCSPLSCQYTALLGQIQNAQNVSCDTTDCPVSTSLAKIPLPNLMYQAVLLQLAPDQYSYAHDMVATSKAESFVDIFETGLLKLDDTDPA